MIDFASDVETSLWIRRGVAFICLIYIITTEKKSMNYEKTIRLVNKARSDNSNIFNQSTDSRVCIREWPASSDLRVCEWPLMAKDLETN